MELRRVLDGRAAINCSRKSTFETAIFKARIPAEHLRALSDTFKITRLCIMPIPEWPEIGDHLGIILEEIFTGVRKDIRPGLQEAAAYARKVLGL